MKRIVLLGAAIAGLLLGGVTSAMAASNASTKKSKTPTTKVSCKASLALQVAAGETDITAGSADGSLMGSSACGKKARGRRGGAVVHD